MPKHGVSMCKGDRSPLQGWGRSLSQDSMVVRSEEIRMLATSACSGAVQCLPGQWVLLEICLSSKQQEVLESLLPLSRQQALIFFQLGSFQYWMLLWSQMGLQYSFTHLAVVFQTCDKQRNEQSLSPFSSLFVIKVLQGRVKTVPSNRCWVHLNGQNRMNDTALLLAPCFLWTEMFFFLLSKFPVAAGHMLHRVCFVNALFPEIKFSGWWPSTCQNKWFDFCCAVNVQPYTVLF